MEISFFIFLALIVLLLVYGYSKTDKEDSMQSKRLIDKKVALDVLTYKANHKIMQLKEQYKQERKREITHNLNDPVYSRKYKEIADKYNKDRKDILTNWKKNNPKWERNRKLWGKIFMFGLLANIIGCGSAVYEHDNEDDAPAVSTAMSNNTVTYWNAKNIPMPHLQDSLQYVSNPDHVLSQITVDSINIYLQKLDHELGIESAVIIVNRIENDDPFRMAQDVGNSYGVGRNDRGLVVVVGYQDHSVNISPGRALEADLTDAECGRLQRDYVIPAMREEKPDSAMLYLTKGIYATMLKKEAPVMSSLYEDDDTDTPTSFILFTLFPIAWGIFFSRKSRQYQWLGDGQTVTLMADPFSYVSHSSSRSSSGGSFGGGGGSFGGGG